jgi:mRNA interferase MazF
VVGGYVPDRGHLVWLDFSPASGHEQSGRRPALVLTSSRYSSKTGLLVCCPVTNVKKGYVFEVELGEGEPATGVVLVDHVKNLSYVTRNCTYIGVASQETTEQVIQVLAALIGVE